MKRKWYGRRSRRGLFTELRFTEGIWAHSRTVERRTRANRRGGIGVEGTNRMRRFGSAVRFGVRLASGPVPRRRTPAEVNCRSDLAGGFGVVAVALQTSRSRTAPATENLRRLNGAFYGGSCGFRSVSLI